MSALPQVSPRRGQRTETTTSHLGLIQKHPHRFFYRLHHSHQRHVPHSKVEMSRQGVQYLLPRLGDQYYGPGGHCSDPWQVPADKQLSQRARSTRQDDDAVRPPMSHRCRVNRSGACLSSHNQGLGDQRSKADKVTPAVGSPR
jgi:hypothetical protein